MYLISSMNTANDLQASHWNTFSKLRERRTFPGIYDGTLYFSPRWSRKLFKVRSERNTRDFLYVKYTKCWGRRRGEVCPPFLPLFLSDSHTFSIIHSRKNPLILFVFPHNKWRYQWDNTVRKLEVWSHLFLIAAQDASTLWASLPRRFCRGERAPVAVK